MKFTHILKEEPLLFDVFNSTIEYNQNSREIGRTKSLCNVIQTTPALIESLKSLVLYLLCNDDLNQYGGNKCRLQDWVLEVACSRRSLIEWSTMAEARKRFIENGIRRPLSTVIFVLEEYGVWDCLLDNDIDISDQTRPDCITFWIQFLEKSRKNIYKRSRKIQNPENGTHIFNNYLVPFRFPFFRLFHEQFEQCHARIKDTPAEGEVISLILTLPGHEDFINFLYHNLDKYTHDLCSIMCVEYMSDKDYDTTEMIKTVRVILDNFFLRTHGEEDCVKRLACCYMVMWTCGETLVLLARMVLTASKCSQTELDDVLTSIHNLAEQNETLVLSGNERETLAEFASQVSSFLVSEVCKSMLPTTCTSKTCKEMNKWRDLVAQVINIADKLAWDEPLLHILRLCKDVYDSVSLYSSASSDHKILQKLSEMGQRERNVFRDSKTLENLHNVLTTLPNIISRYLQKSARNTRSQTLSVLCEIELDSSKADYTPAFVYNVILSTLPNIEDASEFLLCTWNYLVQERGGNTRDRLFYLDTQLQRQDCFYSPVAVVTSDVLETILRKKMTLFSLSSREFTSLTKILESARDIIRYASCCSLAFASAVAFIRAVQYRFSIFTVSSKGIITRSKLQTLANIINATLYYWNSSSATDKTTEKATDKTTDKIRKWAIKLHLLKCLRCKLTRYELHEQCTKSSLLKPMMTDISWNDNIYTNKMGINPMAYYGTQYNEVKGSFALWGTNTTCLTQLLKQHELKQEVRFSVLAFIIERKYLSLTVGQDKPFDALLRTTLRDYFGTKQALSKFVELFLDTTVSHKLPSCLLLSGESSVRNVHIASLVIHVCSVILSYSTGNGNIFSCCLSPSSNMLGHCFFPVCGIPGQRRLKEMISFFCSCKNYILLTQNETSYQYECPRCRKRWTKWNKIGITGAYLPHEADNWTRGYLLEPGKDEDDLFVTIRRLSPICYRVISFLIHSCLLIGCWTNTEVREYIKSNIKTEDTTEIRTIPFIHERLNNDWEVLQQLLNIHDDDLSMLLHSIVKESRRELVSHKYAKDDHDSRNKLEMDLSEKILSRVENVPLSISEFKNSCTPPPIKSEKEIEEVNTPTTVMAKDKDGLRVLMRSINLASFDDLRASSFSKRECLKSSPFLMLFLRWYKKLSYIKYLPALLKWNRAISVLLCHRIERSEKQKSHEDIFKSEFKNQNEESQKSLEEAYTKFEEGWNKVAEGWNVLKVFVDSTDADLAGPLQTIDKSRPLELSLIDSNKPNQLQNMIKALQETQNRFLHEVASIVVYGMEAKTDLRYFGDEDVFTFPWVSLNNLKQQHVINVTDETLCLEFHGISAAYSETLQNRYDFEQIENQLIDSILSNAAVIRSDNDTLKNFAYAGELFHVVSDIFVKVEENVNQESLPIDVALCLKEELICERSFMTNLMKHLESLLHLLKAREMINANPDQSLGEYSNVWLSHSQNHEIIDLLRNPRYSLKLKHIVDLYRVVENLISKDVVITIISQNFCKSLTGEVNERFLGSTELMTEENLRDLQNILNMFVYRFLRSNPDNFDPSECLAKVLGLKKYMPHITEDDRTMLSHCLPHEIKLANIKWVMNTINDQIQVRLFYQCFTLKIN